VTRSLVFRLLALAGVVAAVSISATAWLVMTSTTAAIRDQQGQTLTDDARIYRTLVRYGARHRSWDEVAATVRRLNADTGRTIVLTTPRRVPLARAGRRSPSPAQPTATIDALDVDDALLPDDGDGIIDTVTGPFRRFKRDRRPVVPAPAPEPATRPAERRVASSDQRRALVRLTQLTRRCLPSGSRVRSGQLVDADGYPVVRIDSDDRAVERCYQQARREQLRPYVAPPALLFLGAPGEAAANVDLTGGARRRILFVALLIVGLSVLITGLAAARLIRPLRSLTRAAERMTAGDLSTRVDVHGRDEVGRLGQAFNTMAGRREQLEHQRAAMVSDVAHELRTPVSNIRGWLEAAQDGVAQPDREFVNSLLEEATLLTRIIADLSDLSAAEAGELRLHPERIDLRELLEVVRGAHQPAADAAGVALRVDAQGTITADPIRVRQAVGNLVSNAIRHSPRGGEVLISAAPREDGIAIVVSDAGDGIPPEHHEHVFDRFWRAEQSRARTSGGSGLGLAIVRRLAEAHGGAAIVESAVGAGARFTLWLPCRAAAS